LWVLAWRTAVKEGVLSDKEKIDSVLGGYRVLDLTDEKGLLCGKILGDLGADVIKIEKPGGDAARRIGPFYHNEPNLEKSLFWFAMNTSKRGITLNLEKAYGRDIFKRLVKAADFVIESFQPGYLDKLGLGYRDLEKLNKRVIMVSISPFGQTGPRSAWKTSDIVSWAMGGQMAPCGEPDRPPYRVSHHSQSYLNAGVDAAQGALTALFDRWTTGEGQQVDVSVQESVIQATEHITSAWDRKKTLQKRGQEGGFRMSQLWKCKDGYVSFAYSGSGGGVTYNKAFMEWIASEGYADESFKNFDGKNLDPLGGEAPAKIKELTGKFFLAHTKAELLDGALRNDIQLYPVSTASDILENPQLKARDFWEYVEHPELGAKIPYPGAFARTTVAQPRISRRAPLIGEHNLEVYEKELGLSRDELAALMEAEVI
jgi:crotonobetainyl-CoA:carnitine CoA-transferase CaiB-like acyl-CoA transferase